MSCRTPAALILLVLTSAVVSQSQTAASLPIPSDPLTAYPADRVLDQIDDTQRMPLSRHVHPLATPENLVGTVSPDEPMGKMVLVLRPDRFQEEALEELIRAQQDPASPYYHQWLTPGVFGEHFGVSSNDLAQIANWLETQGMKVDDVPSSRRCIVFSGTAGQVEATFHTPMRQYSVNGQVHFANAAGPEIPRALADVVAGIVSLNDFRSAPAGTTAVPAYTSASGGHLLAPADWATIYDVAPLYSQGLDGNGESITVVGRADISLADVRTFRTNAGLPANDPVVTIAGGEDPGWPNSADEQEAALDVEWAGAIANRATVKFISAASGATDGVMLAAQYAVYHNVAPIVTVSYVHCENELSGGGQSLWGSLWSQAAAQGQSVLVASGDTGAADCDAVTQHTATHGAAINAICSSPNSTCVGGTEFNDALNPGAYWSATNGAGQASALSYIPEAAWNETASSGTIGAASGGGISAVYPRPSWQAAPGVPQGNKRCVPDIAAAAGLDTPYLVQFKGASFIGGGTSAATPSLASLMALVLQNTGEGPLGNLNPALYALATQQAAGGPNVFHDIVLGNNSVPGLTGYSAGPGYDLTTGLGSVDAFLLVNNWKTSTTSSFALAADSASLSVTAGNSVSTTLTMSAQGGFSSPVALSATGLPAGVTARFSSISLTPAAPVTMTLSAAANAPATTSGAMVVTGTAGGFTRTVGFSLTVAGAPPPSGVVAGGPTLSVTGANPSAMPTESTPAVVTPTYTLSAGAATITVVAGGSVPLTITTSAGSGFNAAVYLSVGSILAGVTAGFSKTMIPAPGSGSTVLTLSAASTTPAGVSTFTIGAEGAGMEKSVAVTLTVLPAATFSFASSVTSASVPPGGSVPITFTTTPANGFDAGIEVAVSGVPAGVSASFAPSRIAAPGASSAILTLAAAPTAAPGISTVTVTAQGGGTVKNEAVILTILPASSASSK
jgi:hypothetical protein